VFDEAGFTGFLNSRTYTALMDAYGRARQPGRAKKIFQAAQAARAVDARTYNVLIAAYIRGGRQA